MLAEIPTMDGADVLGALSVSEFPRGYVPQLARAAAVLASARAIPATEPHHRSHVLSWFEQVGRTRAFARPASWPARQDWRWTVDHPADLRMAQQAFELLGPTWPNAGYEEIVQALDGHINIPLINSGLMQKPLQEG
jgi:spore coat polysaccharide biosynthesis protein SpsF (cytidylyltransferase family)